MSSAFIRRALWAVFGLLALLLTVDAAMGWNWPHSLVMLGLLTSLVASYGYVARHMPAEEAPKRDGRATTDSSRSASTGRVYAGGETVTAKGKSRWI